MDLISKSFTFNSLNLDSWSETYIGARWLVENVLPEKQYETSPEHGAISQMVLLASHHMIEIMLFSSIKEILNEEPDSHRKIKKLEKQTFNSVFNNGASSLLDRKDFPLENEPFKSIDKLRVRRNATIHKQSALSTLEMAKSALFTGLRGSESIYNHLNENSIFKYESVINKYPISNYPLFSTVVYPENYHKN